MSFNAILWPLSMLTVVEQWRRYILRKHSGDWGKDCFWSWEGQVERWSWESVDEVRVGVTSQATNWWMKNDLVNHIHIYRMHCFGFIIKHSLFGTKPILHQ